MIPLLVLVLLVEGAVASLLMLKMGPFTELTIRALDQLQTGRGPPTIKTLACTMSLILLSSLTSILKIGRKGVKIGTTTPMDQVLWSTHVLEASLMGFCLLLGFVVLRLHHYLRKIGRSRAALVTSKLQAEQLEGECLVLKEKEKKASQEASTLKEEISRLTDQLQKLKVEAAEKGKQLQAAEANVLALQKQSEDLLLEYDRLLEDNQALQSQSLVYRM
ncbi:unnamed protein product [Victoria cruziana]